MYTKRNYGFFMTFNWSREPFIYGFLYAAGVTAIFTFAGQYLSIDVSLPWQPISVLGITVAFYLGFKNNSSYDRTWEARKIWGGIVNNSRTFGAGVCAFVQGDNSDDIKRQLIYRHVAWLTALRYQLRLSREWEHTEDRLTARYAPTICEDYLSKLDTDLQGLLPEAEWQGYKSKANMATQILLTQTQSLQNLREQGYFEDFRHMELFRLIGTFYDDQGRSERIKNFPFPRQYASTALWQTLIFCILIPWGMLSVFGDMPGLRPWLTVPLSALLIWVFMLMEKIGDYSENPFEGSYNDVPISSISRAIEIDLREMINDANIPAPLKSENGFLM